jgi:hypothetical protein
MDTCIIELNEIVSGQIAAQGVKLPQRFRDGDFIELRCRESFKAYTY